MDLYQIFITHNRPWTAREIICVTLLFAAALFAAGYLIRHQKIKCSQALAGISLLLFLSVVFGSTVFTRMPSKRQFELQPFWSWREVIVNHNRELLKENLLNCILLVPMGILLPILLHRKVTWRQGLLWGLLVSAAIETSQLVFCRGLFEWDDMIHNALGCMAGCLLTNTVSRRKT